MRKVVIFGVFDGVHEGHREFIKSAKMHGDQLVAIVARDSVVEKLKSKTPENTEAMRIKDLLEVKEIDLVYLGDAEEDSYKILEELIPDLIFLGYDQQALKQSLEKAVKEGRLKEVEIKVGKPYKEDIFHTSLLR